MIDILSAAVDSDRAGACQVATRARVRAAARRSGEYIIVPPHCRDASSLACGKAMSRSRPRAGRCRRRGHRLHWWRRRAEVLLRQGWAKGRGVEDPLREQGVRPAEQVAVVSAWHTESLSERCHRLADHTPKVQTAPIAVNVKRFECSCIMIAGESTNVCLLVLPFYASCYHGCIHTID